MRTFLIVEDNDFDWQQQVIFFEDTFGDSVHLVRATTIPEAAQGVRLLFAGMNAIEIGGIIVDMQLPQNSLGLDGYYFIGYCLKLMLNDELPQIPIVALSSDMNEQRIQRSEAAGAAMMIEKPLTIAHMQTLLEIHHEQQAQRPNSHQHGFMEAASDVVERLMHYFVQTNPYDEHDVRALLTALSPALRFTSSDQRSHSIVIMNRLGGRLRTHHILDEYRNALKKGAIPIDKEDYVRDEIEKMAGMLVNGAAQKIILQRFKYGRTRYEARLRQIVSSLTYFINHYLVAK